MAPARSYHSRGRRRASRVLIVLMSAVLGTGAFFWLRAGKWATKPAQAKANASSTTTTSSTSTDGNLADLPITEPVTGKLDAKPLEPRSSVSLLPGGRGPATRPVARMTAFVPPPAPPTPPGPPDQLITTARQRFDTGDLVGARSVLNEAVVANKFPGLQGDAARALLTQINRTLVLSPKRFNDPYVALVQVESGRGLTAIARQHAVPWEAICRVNGVSDRRIRLGQTLKVPQGPFHAVVTKSAYRMDLYLGGLPGEQGALFVISLPVGLGKDDSTPTGVWSVVPGSKGKGLDWTNPRTNEYFKGSDPKNPLGGYWIGLKGEDGNAVGKQSYGIHGTIEQDSIGKQASMGCVRLGEHDIPLVYDLLSEGKSRVLVRE